jgi:hypothetical protein
LTEGIKSAAKEPGRQGDDGLEEIKDGAHGDADEPEGEKQEPGEGIENESQKGQGPAQDK